MKQQLKKILSDYGLDVTIIKNNDTSNDYGEVIEGDGSKTIVRGVLTNTENKFVLRYFGITDEKDFSLLLPYDVKLEKEYEVVIDKKRYKIKSISPLYFKDDVVVYVVGLV